MLGGRSGPFHLRIFLSWTPDYEPERNQPAAILEAQLDESQLTFSPYGRVNLPFLIPAV